MSRETDGIFYFNRCRRCNTILTKLEIAKALRNTNGAICRCGSGMFSPTNLVGAEWLLPRVWKVIVLGLLGRVPVEPEPFVPGTPIPLPTPYRMVQPLSAEELPRDEE